VSVKQWHARAATGSVIPPDTTPPSIPANVTAAYLQPDAVITWDASTDTNGIAVYTVSRDGENIGSTTGALTYVDHNVPDGDHIYQVQATDPSGNSSSRSAWSNAITAATPDVTPPTDPTSASAVYSAPTVTFTWGASTDSESGLLTYIVSINGADAGFAAGTSFTKSGLAPGTYVFGVRALDKASPANVSATVTDTVTIGAVVTYTPRLSDESGKSDVGAELQAFFNSLVVGTALAPTIVEFTLNVLYRCERTILLTHAHLVIHANGATVSHQTLGPFSGQFWIQADDVSIDHLNIKGPNNKLGADGYNALYPGNTGGPGSQYEGMHGIRVVEQDDIHLDNVNVSHVWGDGWSFDGSARCSDCTLTDSTSYWTGRHGLNPNSVNNFTADGVTCIKAGRHGIDVEPDGAGGEGIDGLTITNLAVDGGALGWFSYVGGGSPGHNQMDNLLIDGVTLNNVTAAAGFGRASQVHHNVTIRNVSGSHRWDNVQPNNLNVSVTPPIGSVFEFVNTTGITVQHVHQPVSDIHDMYGVSCTSDCTVIDVSDFTGSNLDGMLIGP